MRIAAQVRMEKERHPERFCPDTQCLWRIETREGFKPCPKHQTWVEAANRARNQRIVDAHRAAYGPQPEDELVLEAGPDALDTDFDDAV